MACALLPDSARDIATACLSSSSSWSKDCIGRGDKLGATEVPATGVR